MSRSGDRTAWLRLNAYGVLLAALCVLNLKGLVRPAGTELSKIIGDVPPGQTVWITGFVIAGILLLFGFARGDRVAETLGLMLITGGVVAQTVVAFTYLGATEYTSTQVTLVFIVGLCAWARCSVLWSKRGLNIRIPARGEHEDKP